MFTVKPLKEILAMSKQALDDAMAPLRARAVKAQADTALVKIETNLIELEKKITEACAKQDIDFDKVMDLMDEFELATRRAEQLKKLVADLFPAA